MLPEDKRALTEYKKFIFSILLKYEKNIVNQAIKLLGLTFEEYIILFEGVVRKHHDTFEVDVLSVSRLVKSVEKRAEKFTDEEVDTILKFHDIMFRVRYVVMQMIIQEGLYYEAMKFANFCISVYESLKGRFGDDFPQKIEDNFLKIKIEKERLEVTIKSLEANKTITIPLLQTSSNISEIGKKIRWLKSKDELLETIKSACQSDKIIIKRPSLTYEDVAFSCFYILGDDYHSNEFLCFDCKESVMLVFFNSLIKSESIDYSNFSRELLEKICSYCKNKKGSHYKVNQLQTVLKNFSISPK